MKKSILDFRKMKETGEKVTWLTAYDYLTAKYEEKAGVDMILIGGSGSSARISSGTRSWRRKRRFSCGKRAGTSTMRRCVPAWPARSGRRGSRF